MHAAGVGSRLAPDELCTPGLLWGDQHTWGPRETPIAIASVGDIDSLSLEVVMDAK